MSHPPPVGGEAEVVLLFPVPETLRKRGNRGLFLELPVIDVGGVEHWPVLETPKAGKLLGPFLNEMNPGEPRSPGKASQKRR